MRIADRIGWVIDIRARAANIRCMIVGPITPVGNSGRSLLAPRAGDTEAPQQSIDIDRAKQEQLRALRERDLEVRTHEAAHLGAAGALAQGGASFSFQIGPDGDVYAVGGSVRVDTNPGATPEETIQKARQLRSAALAPANPSPQDLAVAAAATAMELQARRELDQDRDEKNGSEIGASDSTKVDADARPSIASQNEEPKSVSEENARDIFSEEFLKSFSKGKADEASTPGFEATKGVDASVGDPATVPNEDAETVFGLSNVSDDRLIEEFLAAFVSGTLAPRKGLNVSALA